MQNRDHKYSECSFMFQIFESRVWEKDFNYNYVTTKTCRPHLLASQCKSSQHMKVLLKCPLTLPIQNILNPNLRNFKTSKRRKNKYNGLSLKKGKCLQRENANILFLNKKSYTSQRLHVSTYILNHVCETPAGNSHTDTKNT